MRLSMRLMLRAKLRGGVHYNMKVVVRGCRGSGGLFFLKLKLFLAYTQRLLTRSGSPQLSQEMVWDRADL